MSGLIGTKNTLRAVPTLDSEKQAQLRALLGSAKDGASLKALLDAYGPEAAGAAAELIQAFIASSGRSEASKGKSAIQVKQASQSSSKGALVDSNPAHNRAFDESFQSLSGNQKSQCLELGILSLSTLQFVHRHRDALTRGRATLVEALFAKVCQCSCKPDDGPKQEPLRNLNVDIAGYGEFRTPQARAYPRDPLFIGMSGVVAGAVIEIRNRSKGIVAGQVQPWIKLPVGTAGVRAEDGRLHIAIGPQALRQLKLDAWDQFEIRQRHPDGRVSKEELPQLGTARTAYQLPTQWNEVTAVNVGEVTVPPASVFHGFADTSLVELNPMALDQKFLADPTQSGSGTFRVSASVEPGDPYAKFVEPRARVYLKNIRTQEQSMPVSVEADGTFEATLSGNSKDSYEMHIYDQGRADDDLRSHRILTLSAPGARPVVAYSPTLGLPEATDLIMDTLSAQRSSLASNRGVTPGSIVTVTDLDTNAQSRVSADALGSFDVPAVVKPGKIFEIRVENPFSHAENEARRKQGHAPLERPELGRTVRVQVQADGRLTPVAVDQYPPSSSTCHVEPASKGDRSFDPNVDVDFMPRRLGYQKDSRARRTGGVYLELDSSLPLRAQGQIQTRSLIQSRDGSKLQIVLEPQLSNAVGVAEGQGESFTSSIGARFGGFSRNNAQLSFGSGNFLNGYREHIDVEIIRPDGSLVAKSELRPGKVAFSDHGEYIEDWSFSGYEKAEGVVPVLDIHGRAAGATQAPSVRAEAWIQPSKRYELGTKMSPEELQAFSQGKVSGKLHLQLDVAPPPGRAIEDIASIEVVNLNDHPGGFAERDAIQCAKLGRSADSGRSLVELTTEATRCLNVHLQDQLAFRVIMKDGTTSEISDPVKVGTSAKKTAINVQGDFISAGVTTRWEQIHVGDTYQGSIAAMKGDKIEHRPAVIAPPPSRDAANWSASVKFRTRDDGLVEMSWKPGAVATGAKFYLRNYSTNSPYGTDSLYATTSLDRPAPLAGERPRLAFKDPGEHGIISIEVGGQRVIYPPKMKNDPRVKKTFGEG